MQYYLNILTINIIPGSNIKEDKLLDNYLILSYDNNKRLIQLQVLDASKKAC